MFLTDICYLKVRVSCTDLCDYLPCRGNLQPDTRILSSVCGFFRNYTVFRLALINTAMKSKVLFYGLFIDFNGLCHLRRTLRDM
ncbi:hypothetical protein NSP_24750 [Nodularia spumigena CCY9414]|nr:hypothetical protein NSP_24750 [Nodularia spumigena CCY9414]